MMRGRPEPEVAPEPEMDGPRRSPKSRTIRTIHRPRPRPTEDVEPEWWHLRTKRRCRIAEDLADEALAAEETVDMAEDDTASDEPAADETILDEDALRELVARMVREELQGSVGERITHNVRRMVRREIARALSLQNFE